MEIIYFITVKDLLLADFGLVIGVIISILSYKHIELAYMNILRICKKKVKISYVIQDKMKQIDTNSIIVG